MFQARLEPDSAVAAPLKGASVLAFCGIGRPEKFFRTLEACGAAVAVRRGFPDHHGFSGQELDALVREAEAASLVLVTTEKDAVRVQNDPVLRAYARRLLAVPVTLRLDDEAGLRDRLRDALSRARSLTSRTRTEP
jgi:tetraacyldisaccharide 4'-kinase